MSEQISWADLMASARRKATEIASDAHAQAALVAASATATAAARALDPGLRIVGRTETPPLGEVTAAVDELVEVVLVQQELIENLLMRMTRLEQALPRAVQQPVQQKHA